MSLSGKITIISCQIDLGAIEPVSNGLIFRPLYRMVVRFMLRKEEKMELSVWSTLFVATVGSQ